MRSAQSGENAPLDSTTPSNNLRPAPRSSALASPPSVSSCSRESRPLGSSLGALDHLNGGASAFQFPGHLSNAAYTPTACSSTYSPTGHIFEQVYISLLNSPEPPKPTFTPKFSPGSVGLRTPRYLLSKRKPGTVFVPDPSPIPPGQNIALKLPPWRQDYCIDNDEWLWDFDRYSPPPRPNAHFLGGDE
ncbi:hypothetical protein RhiJN_21688 [Ceratobasidium sp. AG-Ba]|nr:hypothetical protein RhiJN_21688 [Ceratobasidium sp. AG-Ba]